MIALSSINSRPLLTALTVIGFAAAVPAGASGGSGTTGGTLPKVSGGSECDRGKFRLLIDVGHTAEIPGAMSARGVPEYAFNLGLAREIESTLKRDGFRNTLLLVTGGGTFAGLAARVKRANDWPADLFVSIHHDSVPARFLETWQYEGAERRYSDRFRGHSLFVSAENGRPEASLHFARLLGDELKARGLAYTPHYAEAFMQERRRQLLDREAGVYRYDELIVLRKTRMSAVLLEAGSIVNREEEQLLGTPGHRALIAAAVTEAVEVFCRSR